MSKLVEISHSLRQLASIVEIAPGRPSETAKRLADELLPKFLPPPSPGSPAEVCVALEAAFLACQRLRQFYADPWNDIAIIEHSALSDADKAAWIERISKNNPKMYHDPLPTAEHLRSIADILAPSVGNADDDPPKCYVTLTQIAAIMGNTSKRTARRLYDDGTLPPPDVQGGTGRPHKWRWDAVRPILELKTGRALPAVFPADRFVRN